MLYKSERLKFLVLAPNKYIGKGTDTNEIYKKNYLVHGK